MCAFSCDNIYGFEVVLASGEVVYASETSHSDLWLALKGGSNYLGIVTRFDVATFPDDLMWYNLVEYNYPRLTYFSENPDAGVYMQLFKIWENGTGAFDNPRPVARGNNLFGLTPGKTDYVIVDTTAAYGNESDDTLVETEMYNIVDKQKAVLKSSGYLIDFVYFNYADISQGVYSSWGADNVAQLQAASRKYDPNGVFQHMVPGGYKVFK
ncbi:hypothetical protein SLS53_007706 [Cytospora paraplurivora]|uniref:Berberine/berberine-like domain-containing protein n=1 Tax=Cytospora paraplurivora TaxID=2898453 RepID=A0AAN9U2F8_9PEZI